jgi:hypothetical protein
MSRLKPEKLHVRFAPSTTADGPVVPRRYTLTHSDVTGDLFLTIGPAYDHKQISGLYTRFMRDEVLAEWREHHPSQTTMCRRHFREFLVIAEHILLDRRATRLVY